jgi:hypothetical protein
MTCSAVLFGCCPALDHDVLSCCVQMLQGLGETQRPYHWRHQPVLRRIRRHTHKPGHGKYAFVSFSVSFPGKNPLTSFQLTG